MAKMYGGKSEYLETNKKWSIFSIKFYGVILLTIIPVAIWHFSTLIYGEAASIFDAIIGVSIVLILFSPVALYTYGRINFNKKEAANFKQGQKGEGAIFYELRKLQDKYSVFQNLHPGGDKRDTDFIVVGPTGIFAIEVKSHKGDVTFEDNKLLHNKKEFEKNFLNQTLSEALELREYLKDKLKKEFRVTPVLVFSSEGAKIHFGLKPVHKGVHVVQKKYLRKLIYSNKAKLSESDRFAIEEAIKELINKK